MTGSVYFTVGVANNGDAPAAARRMVEREARDLMEERNWDFVRITQRHPETLVVVKGLVCYEYDLVGRLKDEVDHT